MLLNKELRRRIVDIIKVAKEGHIPSSFSIVDIIDHLYGQILDYDPKNPSWTERDHFILSKGHGCAALYVVLEKYGLLTTEQLAGYSKPGGILGGHPDVTKVPFVEASTGSLGHGFPYASGIALGKKIKQQQSKVYCLLGDGECHEGTIWEAAHIAANQKLDNLVAIVDWNQSGEQLCPIDDLPAKWQSFGWQVEVFNGHDQQALNQVFEKTKQQNKPMALIAQNVKGKGVSFVEGHGPWHHKIPSEQEYLMIMEELS